MAQKEIANTDFAQTVLYKEKVELTNTGTEITDSRTLVLDDNGKVFEVNKATDVTLTIPTNANAAFPVGSSITFIKTSSGSVVFQGDTGVTVNSAFSLNALITTWDSITIRKINTNTWVLFGADGNK